MRRRHGCCSSPGRQCSSSTVVLRLAAKARAAAAAPCGRQRSSSVAALRLAARERERWTGDGWPGTGRRGVEALRRRRNSLPFYPLRCCFFGFGAARGISRELGRGVRGAADGSGSVRAAEKPIFTLRWGCPAMQPFRRPGIDWASTQRLGMDEKCVPLVLQRGELRREVIVFTSPRQGQFLRAQRTAARQHLST